MNSLLALWMNNLRKGWRRTAAINTLAVTTFTLLVAILLASSISQSGGGVDSNLIFFDGDCAKSASMNLWLHLLLNACSTGVIASSNFFMQVLSSPTRREIDKAHRESIALEIGVPSLSNTLHLAWFKGVFWLLFFASSFPIHLFFNSAIFATEYKGADFHLTIASEAFIDGAQYFGPGAVLWRAGAPRTESPGAGYGSVVDPDYSEGYGTVVNATEYFDPSNEVAKNIEFAARSSRRWKRLEVPECLSRYVYCDTHNEFRDVVWVVKSHNSSGNFMVPGNHSLGWRRDYLLAPMDLLDSSFWDGPSPRWGNNSLWFAANCSTSVYFNRQTHTTGGCYQSCSSATGRRTTTFDSRSAESIPSDYTFDFFPVLDYYTEEELSQVHWPGLSDPSAATLDLKYCLAEEISTTCKVGLSNKILLVVLVCLMIKTALCIVVLLAMPSKDPLVVPGDAVASFIRSPDKFTAGWCTLDRKLESQASITGRYAAATTKPSQWRTARHRRWASAITTWVWGRSYLLFLVDIIFVGAMFGVSQKSDPLGSRGQTLSHSATNGILTTNGETAEQLLSCVVTANLPQLLLSLSYFVYNSLYTRLCTEKEWSSYGTDYHPLRVTRPQGQQRSTYRLQLPYKYSIPLIVISIVLHWLVSNALYVFVLEGGYYWVMFEAKSNAGTGLSDDVYIGVGYSTIALLAIFIAAAVLAVIPFALARRTVKGSMPLGGSNSLVISAACHVPVLDELPAGGSQACNSDTTTAEQQSVSAVENENKNENDQTAHDEPGPQQNPRSETLEMQRLLTLDGPVSSSKRSNEDDDEYPSETALDAERYLLDASQKPLRWGAVEAFSWSQQHPDQRDDVGHLSFGTRDHCVQEPVDGQWYA